MDRAPRIAACCFALAAVAFIPATASSQPAFFEPTQGFYKARGANVAAAWRLDRTTVRDGGAVTATLVIRGAVNPEELVRPDLAKVRDEEGRFPFAERFQIENVAAAPAKPDAKEVRFVYQLRPRGTGVNRLPTLSYWYKTDVRVGNPFQRTRAKGIDITVTPAARAKPPAIPLNEPGDLFEIRTGPEVLDRPRFSVGWLAGLALFALGLLASGGWYAAWRRIYPEGARLARMRRNRAFRRATQAIRKAGRSPDPAAAMANAILAYLRTRFPLPPGADTPSEVEGALLAAGLDAANAGRLAAFLRACDEARFSQVSPHRQPQPADAETLLASLESAE